jgi:hypothetical protein
MNRFRAGRPDCHTDGHGHSLHACPGRTGAAGPENLQASDAAAFPVNGSAENFRAGCEAGQRPTHSSLAARALKDLAPLLVLDTRAEPTLASTNPRSSPRTTTPRSPWPPYP